MNSSEEKQYIDQAIQGNVQAFNLLIDFYYADCFRKAKAIVQEEVVAQDLTQISLLQAYHCLDKIKDASRFKYWLLGIVNNISHNYLRQKKKRIRSLQELQTMLLESQPQPAGLDLKELVLSAVYGLETHYREIILAFYYDAISLQDFAHQEKLSLSAAKVRLYRARRLLKQQLALHQDLFYYHQKSTQQNPMKTLTIADIYLKEDGSATMLLQTEAGDVFLPIVIGYFDAQAIVNGMQHLQMPRPQPPDVAASIIATTGAKLNGIYIHKLVQGVFHAYLSIQNNSTPVEVDARPSDAIAIAVRLQAPILVAERVLEEAGIPIPKPYQRAKAKGKGISQFVRYFAQFKVNQLAHQPLQQKAMKPSQKKKPEKLDQWVVDLVFGEAHPPKVNLAWQPRRYTTWAEALKEKEKVEWLDLKNQDLTTFSEMIRPFDQVKTLELTGYGLNQVPANIEQLAKLSRLNLADNQLNDLPVAINQLSQLRELNLSRNRFVQLPQVIHRLPALQKLDLSENADLLLQQALGVLSKSKSLHHLLLKNNRLATIPAELAKLSKLAFLILDGNPLLDLSGLFSLLQKLPSLHTLELQQLELVSLPEPISLLQHLVGLNLNDNPTIDVKSLCESLSQLRNLKVLMLMRCNLTYLPTEFQALSQLEVLELGENQIAEDEQNHILRMLPNTTVVF